MRRKIGMWMAVICILVVGISVTRMTNNFVTSKQAEMAADSDMRNMETSAETAAFSAMAAGQAETGMPDEAVPQETEAAGAEEAPRAAALSLGAAETKTEEQTDEAEEVPEAASEQQAADGSAQVFSNAASGESLKETVKSPLDPVVSEEDAGKAEEDLTASYGTDDFLRRFENAEVCSEKVWENVTADNTGAGSAAAEQERALWDYELNLVYRTIRSRLSEEKAEELKILELEWLKERDRYADRQAGKSAVINGVSADYTKALTVKTKERCYWLVSEYEEVLNEK